MNLGTFATLARYRPEESDPRGFRQRQPPLDGGFDVAYDVGYDGSRCHRAGRRHRARRVGRRRPSISAKRFVEALEREDLSVIVAKVAAVGPDHYGMDLQLPENAFRFRRWILGTARREYPVNGAVSVPRSASVRSRFTVYQWPCRGPEDNRIACRCTWWPRSVVWARRRVHEGACSLERRRLRDTVIVVARWRSSRTATSITSRQPAPTMPPRAGSTSSRRVNCSGFHRRWTTR